MKLGFTGTRKGMNAPQLIALERLWGMLRVTELHHGKCVGGDEQIHNIAVSGGEVVVYMHPPEDKRYESASCRPSMRVFSERPAPYHVRNLAIVMSTDLLIAAPDDLGFSNSEGTCFTAFTAMELERDLIVIWRDGSISVNRLERYS